RPAVAVRTIADWRFRIADRCPFVSRNRFLLIGNRDEPHQHHRAADFWRHSGIFSHLRPGDDAEVQGWRLSIAGAIFHKWLRNKKADYVGPYRLEIARPVGGRKR